MQAAVFASASVILSYFLGAVPFALLAGRVKGIDIRAHGSGNLGATNAIRVLGKPLGLTVFVLDFFKGFGPVCLIMAMPRSWFPVSDQVRVSLSFVCGLAAVTGHIFPIYLKFAGGKGVAATTGVLLAIRWDAALLSFAVFYLIRRFSGYVSASSMALAFAFPLALIALHPGEAFERYRWVTVGSVVLAVLIACRHKANIVRIIKGNEPKVGKRKG